MSFENMLSSVIDHEAFQAVAGKVAQAYDAVQTLPKGSAIIGGLCLSWLVNRWLTDRALNNGNAPAQYDWAKEIIVVTGGAGGIGAQIVKTLADRGSRVVVLDVLPLSYPKSKNIHYYKCDLTNYDDLQAVAARIRKDVGEVTIAVANAGICRAKPILVASKTDVETTFAVNNLAMLWTAKTFMPSMIEKNHGHFLIVASQTGYLATPGLTDYSASKSAAIAIYEGLHAEVKNIYNAPSVRVSCVSPSAVDTKMFSGIKLGPGMSALRPEDLGLLIANIIHGGRAKHVLVPKSAAIATFTRTLPDWVRVAMQAAATGMFTDLKPHDPMKASTQHS